MNNSSNNIRIAQAKINQVIARLSSSDPRTASALRTLVAQGFGGSTEPMFDLGQMGGNPSTPVMPFKADSTDDGSDPSADLGGDIGADDAGDDGSDGGSGLNPGIDSYVKPSHGGGQALDQRRTHKCAVTFKAPEGVGEDEMMNYILGIGKALGVDVDSFNWSKTEAKPAAGVR